MRTRADELFFSAATQYYIVGRFAVLSGQVPVAGNMIHHAIEMYLKGGLAKNTNLQQLRGFGHELPKLWAAFKAQFTHPALTAFDNVISALHAFEDIRYPDSILAKGMMGQIGVTRGPIAFSSPGSPEPVYELYLEEIDALVDRIFSVASVNPGFFFSYLSPAAKQYLKEANAQQWAG